MVLRYLILQIWMLVKRSALLKLHYFKLKYVGHITNDKSYFNYVAHLIYFRDIFSSSLGFDVGNYRFALLLICTYCQSYCLEFKSYASLPYKYLLSLMVKNLKHDSSVLIIQKRQNEDVDTGNIIIAIWMKCDIAHIQKTVSVHSGPSDRPPSTWAEIFCCTYLGER